MMDTEDAGLLMHGSNGLDFDTEELALFLACTGALHKRFESPCMQSKLHHCLLSQPKQPNKGNFASVSPAL